VRDLRLGRQARVGLLGTAHELAWRQRDADVVIAMPVLADGELPFSGPQVVKIEGLSPD
jgi:hypothetical protein